jgi:hypothetical protein
MSAFLASLCVGVEDGGYIVMLVIERVVIVLWYLESYYGILVHIWEGYGVNAEGYILLFYRVVPPARPSSCPSPPAPPPGGVGDRGKGV